MVRLRRRALVKRAHDVKPDMIAPRGAPVEIDGEEIGLLAELDIALFAQLTRQCRHHRFARLNAAARQMPAGDIAVLDQKHASDAVDDDGADAECQPAREPPIEMEEALDERLKRSAERFEVHPDIAVSARLADGGAVSTLRTWHE